MKKAIDISTEFDANMISVCPLIDGSDHPFHVDHMKQWHWAIEAFQEVANYNADVKISIEYKAYEVRNRIILPSMGKTLHFCDRVGSENIGVTMDLGHSLMEQESPTAEMAVAHDAGRLFYIHFNDNNRQADWDMPVGSVNLWETLEAIHFMDKIGYDGWIAYDVFTRAGTGSMAISHTFETMEDLRSLIAKIGDEKIQELRESGDSAYVSKELIKHLL